MYYYYYRPDMPPAAPMMPQHGTGSHHPVHGQPFHPQGHPVHPQGHPGHWQPPVQPLHPIYPPPLTGGNPLASLLGGLGSGSFGNLLTAPSAVPANVMAGLPSPPPQAVQRYHFLVANQAEMQNLVQQAALQPTAPASMGTGLSPLPSLTGEREDEEESRFPWLLPFCVFRWAILITSGPWGLNAHLGIIISTNVFSTTLLQVLPTPALGTIPTSSVLFVECF